MMLPKDKFDIETANIIAERNGILLDNELIQLLEWIQDGNWPAAKILLPYLKNLRQDLTNPILSVLNGDDYTWMYWIVDLINPKNINDELRHKLEQIAHDPTRQEQNEGLPEKIQAILSEADILSRNAAINN